MATDFTKEVPGVAVARGLGLDPRQPYEQAAAGAKDAQAQANALSQLQWQRQMMGLQGAMGFQNNLQQLYNSIYSPGGGVPAAGGGPAGGPDMSAMMALSAPPQQQAPPEQEKSPLSYLPIFAGLDKLSGGKASRGAQSALSGLGKGPF